MFVGKIGEDCMGRLIREKMAGYGVSMDGCVMDPMHFTTQAFVTLDKDGERSFSFSRRFGADIWLREEELPIEKAVASSMAAFSGMCMTDEPVRSATWRFLRAVYDLSLIHILPDNREGRVFKRSRKAITHIIIV